MKIARHLNAGYVAPRGESPGGTTEISSEYASKRPHGTHRLRPGFPGTEVPGYFQLVPTERLDGTCCSGLFQGERERTLCDGYFRSLLIRW
jgi:hypothetical protein